MLWALSSKTICHTNILGKRVQNKGQLLSLLTSYAKIRHPWKIVSQHLFRKIVTSYPKWYLVYCWFSPGNKHVSSLALPQRCWFGRGGVQQNAFLTDPKWNWCWWFLDHPFCTSVDDNLLHRCVKAIEIRIRGKGGNKTHNRKGGEMVYCHSGGTVLEFGYQD